MNKYDAEYLDEKLADLAEFQTALDKRAGVICKRDVRFPQTDAILLYSLWRR